MAEFYTGNFYLSRAQMEVNARYVYNYLGSRGWTNNAIAGILGNMQAESTINPGIWQNLSAGSTSLGYGLVQWTPATKYLNWCDEQGIEPSHMDSALRRIIYELNNGLQYYPTAEFPETFKEFTQSTKSPYYLGMAFVNNYERPSVISTERGTNAAAWYEFLTGEPAPSDPDTPAPTPDKKRNGLPLLMMFMATRRW